MASQRKRAGRNLSFLSSGVRNVCHELDVGQERRHSARREAKLQVNAAVPAGGRKRRSLAVELVGPAAAHGGRRAPPEVVIEYGEPRWTAHGQDGSVRVAQRKAPRRPLPLRHHIPYFPFPVRGNAIVDQRCYPLQLTSRHVPRYRRRGDALNCVTKVPRVHRGVDPMTAVDSETQCRCRVVTQAVFPCPSDGSPHQGAQSLERWYLADSRISRTVDHRFQPPDCLSCELEDPLAQWGAGVESQLGASLVVEPENSGWLPEEASDEDRRLGDLRGATAADLRPRVQQIPERRAVDNRVVDRAADEDGAVGKFRQPDSCQRTDVTLVADDAIEIEEEILDACRDVGLRNWKRNMRKAKHRARGGQCAVRERDAGIIAADEDGAVGVSDEAAGQRRKEGEGAREGFLEEVEDEVDGSRRPVEEETFLDVVAREHGHVGDGELELSHGRLARGIHRGFGEKYPRRGGRRTGKVGVMSVDRDKRGDSGFHLHL